MGLPAEVETSTPYRDLVLSENALGLAACSFASDFDFLAISLTLFLALGVNAK